MAESYRSRVQRISEMAKQAALDAADNPQSWKSFLNTAANVYKYSFSDQLLIYAQYPDATAVATIDIWNKKMNRWVNKGTHGIALIDDTRARPGLKYVFDLRDTHMGYNGRTPYLWTLRPEHEARLQEHLAETYDLENIYPNSLPETLLETARASVRENLSEYMEYFREAAQDSFLEELDDLNQTVRMRETMAASVAYLLLKRCGYQPDEYLNPDSLQFITDFNTFPVICHLGDAVNNTAKPVLMDIGREIRSMERESFLQNSLASEQRTIYNKSSERFSTLIHESDNMGGASYEREQETDIHANRRLSDPQPDDGRTAGGNSRQIRDAAENISEGTQGRDVSISSSERQADRASSGDRSDSQPTSGTDREPDAADEPGTGQSNRSDSMGSAHDSPEPDSRGDGSERSDLRLEPDTPESSENVSHPEAEDVTSSAFSLPSFPTEAEQIEELGRQKAPAMLSDRVPLSVLDKVLTGGGNRDKSQLRIAAIFMSDIPEEKRSVLLAKEYDTTDIGLQIDGEKYAVYCDPHGIQIAYGDMVDGATDKAFVSWETAVSRIETLLDEGRFLPQVVLDNALDNECEELAESLLFAYRDYNFDQYDFPYFDFKELYHGTFPDAKEELARRLHSPENIQEHIRVLKQLHEDCLENPDRMRFQMYIARMPDILDRLERLSTARQHYRTAEDFIPHSRSLFLTQDAIDSYFINRHMDSRLGTYSAYLQMDKKQLADYIKNSYGIAGGQSHALRGSDKTWMDYSSKGIKFTMGDLSSPTDTVFLSWSKVADQIQRLIRDGKYIHDDDRAHMRDFEREKLAREIVSFVSSTPLELREDIPFPLVENLIADYSEQVRELTLLLEDESQAESIASYMQITLDQLPEDTRNMDSLKQYTEHVMSYAAGTYSLFPEAEKTDAKLQEPSRNIPTELTKEPVIRTVASGEQLSLFDFMTPDTEPEAKVEQEPQKAEKARPKPYDTFLSSEAQNEYNALKEKYPDHLIGFEQKRPDIGFFEFYGEDARIVTDILGTQLKNKDLEDGINVAMAEILAEDWSDAVQKLWRQGNNIYLAALSDHGTHYKAKELQAENYIPLGLELKIEGHDFRVDNVNFRTNEVTMMDLTFMNQFRYPLSRVEPIDFVYNYINEQASISERLTSLDPAPEPADSAVTSVKEIPSSDLTAEPVSESEADVPEPAKPHTAENYKIIDDHLGEGGPKAKFQRNIAAIKLLQELEFDDRMATPDEQEVLAQYVGWGGLPMAFDEHNVTWAKEHKQLKELLSPPEYEAARESVLNAHYTSPTVIRAVYEAIGNMGFTTGNILEPSCGTGNFFGCLPDSMSASRLYGVELDSITGRIAKQLYPKANITIDGFEKTNYPNDTFDVVVGNVPFGSYQVADPKYDRHHFMIHDYFIAKSLDQVRPGGVVAVLTSSGTLDKKDTSVRKYYAQRADLLGAIRLPNNAFQKNAGTNVVADILFFQKRDRAPLQMPEWVELGQTEDGHPINSYFLSHPEMVLGTLTTESTQYGKMELTVAPIEDADLGEQLHAAIQNIHGRISEYELSDTDLDAEDILPADPDIPNFSYALADDKIYYRENSVMNRMDLPAATAERVKGMVELRDTTRLLLKMQLDGTDEDSIHEQMGLLNRQYDTFTQKYGLINSTGNKRAFSQDSSYPLLSSLEVLDEEGNLERKADIFIKRTIKRPEPITSVDTAVEALSVSMGEKACVDLDYMAQLCGKPEDEIIQDLHGLIFKDPVSEKWQTADEYLSGNVRKKLKTAALFAENHPEYAVNVEYLKQVQPKDLTAGEIDVRLGVNWLEPSIIQQFMVETFRTPFYMTNNRRSSRIAVEYAEISGEWSIRNKTEDSNNVLATSTYGTKRVSGYRLLEDSLNQRSTKIYDTVLDAEGNERRVLNQKETILAQQKQDAIKQAFKDWIFKDPERRNALVSLYNERFNSIRPREFDGSHLTFPGMNPQISMRPHQKNVVAHILYGQNCLVAHTVGAGKTFACIAAAMESKRLGLCQKSLFVVPNHLLDQWGSDILRLYPNANILVANQKDFQPANRKRFCSRIATGDYDAVVIGHTQFEKIPLSAERQRKIITEQINDVTDALEMAKEQEGSNFTIKQLEATRKRLKARLEKLTSGKAKDNVVTFEELGVDRLFVDESQNFKNLYTFTKMSNIAGISTTDAQKSSDMYGKCRYMDELTGGRGITFATGTPISNSMTELYTLMRYLQHDLLDEMGLQHFDNWAAQFGETTTAIELAPEGTGYRAKTRFSRFFNLPELMSAWKECADIQTADMLNLPTPEAIYENVIVPPSEEQRALVASLAERAETIHAGAVDPSVDNMLKVTNDGRKIALDQRLTNPLLPDHPGSKVNACVDRTFQIWTDTAEQKLTQVIFCDLSTPSGKGKSEFNVYDDIKAKLIARGVPAEEIAFIHDANTEVQKATLFSKVRSGQVRVILGSTSKMGAGTNIQDKLVALHHLDTPWRPSDVEQQEGRILRQGNTNKQVHIFRYLTEQTFDSYMWQILENKQKFIGQVMTSKSPSRSCEDTDEVSLKYAEVKALASGNPLILEKTQLDTDVTKLKLMKANHVCQHYALEDRLLKSFPKQIQTTEELINGLQKDLQTVKQNLPPDADHFQMTVAGRLYTNRKEAGAALIDSCSHLQSASTGGKIGNYAGFTLQAQFDSFSRQFYLVVKGHTSHSIELGDDPGGNITRLNNLLNSFEKRLEEQTQKLNSLHSQVEEAKAELERPFPQEEELNEKQARLNEVNALLDIDNRGSNTASKGERASVIPLSSGQQKTAYADALPKRPSVLEKLNRYKDAVSSDHLTKHLSKQQSL